MYYSSVGLLAIVILLIINFDVFRKPKYGEAIRAQLSYRSFLFSVLNYYLTDVFWGFFYTPKYVTLSYVDTVFYFSAMALSVFFWILYIVNYINEKNKFFTILRYAGILFISAEFLILIINLFTPIMFWFDSKGNYKPGPARHTFMIIQVIL